jgi:hypothetical protein
MRCLISFCNLNKGTRDDGFIELVESKEEEEERDEVNIVNIFLFSIDWSVIPDMILLIW